MVILKRIILTILVIHPLVISGTSYAQPNKPCGTYSIKFPHQSILANANFFDNLRNREGSLRFESYALFIDASRMYKNLEKPVNLCPNYCKLPDTPHFLFSSIPNQYKSSYRDKEKCSKYLEETTINPLRYTKKLPRGIDPTNDWISEFSQGDGKEGEDLYSKCDGKCSPQYHYNIHLENDLLVTDAHVICGHARDKDDNQYKLSSYFVWQCQDKIY